MFNKFQKIIGVWAICLIYSAHGFQINNAGVGTNQPLLHGPNYKIHRAGIHQGLTGIVSNNQYRMKLTPYVQWQQQVTSLNQAPVVVASYDQGGLVQDIMTLSASIEDDGFPLPSSLSMHWNQFSGPTGIQMSSPNSEITNIQFTSAGDYGIEIVVSDGDLETRDIVYLHIYDDIDQNFNYKMAQISHDGSKFTFGSFPSALFDGNTSTLGLANYANEPVAIDIQFPTEVKVSGARAWWAGAWGNPAYRWKLEAANSTEDLNSQSDSYLMLDPEELTVSEAWSTVNFAPVSRKVFRFTGTRLTGDGFVHLNELELIFASSNPYVFPISNPGKLAISSENKLTLTNGSQGLVQLNEAGQFLRKIQNPALGEVRDLAFKPNGNILVLAENGLFEFTANAQFQSKLISSGTQSGQLSNPTALDVDDQGKLYISEAGSHRVQCFQSNGSLYSGFGQNGIIGGFASESNGYFNQPEGLYWDATHSELLVADHLNDRIQIFNSAGQFLRKIEAIYHPRDLLVDSYNRIVSVGDGLNFFGDESGSLTFSKLDADFPESYFRNGAGTLGAKTMGITQATNGDVMVMDASYHFIHHFSPNFVPDMDSISMDAQGNQISFSYQTGKPCASEVLITGENGEEFRIQDPQLDVHHQIMVTGLSPSTRYHYQIAYQSGYQGNILYTPPTPITTEPANPNQINIMRLKTFAIIYSAYMSETEKSKALEHFNFLDDFYFRNSRGRLWLDLEIIQIDRAYTSSEVAGGFHSESVTQDLIDLGYDPATFDKGLVVVRYSPLGGYGANLGGTGIIMNKQVGYSHYVTATPFVLVHEVNHAVDALYNLSDYGAYRFNHGIWNLEFPEMNGYDGTINGGIIRDVPTSVILGLKPSFGSLYAVTDSDHDGIGEDANLPVNEFMAGFDPLKSDADQDGLNDLEEMQRGLWHSTNPINEDTDGDIVTQGGDSIDRNPLVPINAYIKKATPVIDGQINPSENWTLIGQNFNYANGLLLSYYNQDNNAYTNTKQWAAWDDDAFYYAIEFTNATSYLRFDLAGNGWWKGFDNQFFEFNGNGINSQAAYAASQDLMYIIPGGGGGWSEIADNNDYWTKSRANGGMGLGPIYDRNEIDYQVSSIGSGRYLMEIRIPANHRRGFQPEALKEINYRLEIGGDILTEDDVFSNLLLINNMDSDGDQIPDDQEIDLGKDPFDPAR